MNTKWKPEYKEELILCKTCGEYKIFDLFSKKGSQKPYICKICINIKYREKSRNIDFIRERNRELYKINKTKINENRRIYLKKRRDEDPWYRVRMALHCRLYIATKNKIGKTMELTGCSKEYLHRHLEMQFTDGMNWDNYGEWHIDHIHPCASFDLENPEEQRKCFHYTNLQPLWAIDNIKKGAKY
jgi:hypothetical protein